MDALSETLVDSRAHHGPTTPPQPREKVSPSTRRTPQRPPGHRSPATRAYDRSGDSTAPQGWAARFLRLLTKVANKRTEVGLAQQEIHIAREHLAETLQAIRRLKAKDHDGVATIEDDRDLAALEETFEKDALSLREQEETSWGPISLLTNLEQRLKHSESALANAIASVSFDAGLDLPEISTDASSDGSVAQTGSDTDPMLTQYFDRQGEVHIQEERLVELDRRYRDDLVKRNFARDQEREETLSLSDGQFEREYRTRRDEIEVERHLAERDAADLAARCDAAGLSTSAVRPSPSRQVASFASSEISAPLFLRRGLIELDRRGSEHRQLPDPGWAGRGVHDWLTNLGREESFASLDAGGYPSTAAASAYSDADAEMAKFGQDEPPSERPFSPWEEGPMLPGAVLNEPSQATAPSTDVFTQAHEQPIPRPKVDSDPAGAVVGGPESTHPGGAQVSQMGADYATTGGVKLSNPSTPSLQPGQASEAMVSALPVVSEGNGLRYVSANHSSSLVTTTAATRPVQLVTDPVLYNEGIWTTPAFYGAAREEERLYSTFRTRKHSFFNFGRVFKILWSEPASDNATVISPILRDGRNSISSGRYGETVYSKIRRFVVVREGSDFCTALPIVTYSSQGVSKSGIVKFNHSIIYTGATAPQPLRDEYPRKGEEGMRPTAIRVVPDDRGEMLDSSSRIDYAKVHTIHHNIKVAPFGVVHPASLEPLQRQWRNVWLGPSADASSAASAKRSSLESKSRRSDPGGGFVGIGNAMPGQIGGPDIVPDGSERQTLADSLVRKASDEAQDPKPVATAELLSESREDWTSETIHPIRSK
ncbi:hypothetical protein LTR53_001117 [Teratosphaeriaceae sp. CCFEE 6253]|nr:hypothetical protein LTR53_001117 [Teratosphaeriaceae sp. CCFEE 6253]